MILDQILSNLEKIEVNFYDLVNTSIKGCVDNVKSNIIGTIVSNRGMAMEKGFSEFMKLAYQYCAAMAALETCGNPSEELGNEMRNKLKSHMNSMHEFREFMQKEAEHIIENG